jgi:DNA replication protein DnaC
MVPTRPSYNCDLCADQGYRGWKTPFAGYPLSQCQFCECERGGAARAFWQQKEREAAQLELNRLFVSAGIPAHFRDMTIDSLIERAGRDPGKTSAIDAVIQFKNSGYVLDQATKKYKSGIVLSGSFGCGKTGLLTPALRNAIEGGKSGLWVEVYDLIIAIQQGYSDGDSAAKLTAAQTADVVLLDDLGDVARDREETEDRRRIVYQLINYRHNHALPMLITTNCNGAQLAKQFGARTVERIFESCAWVSMGGQNLRKDQPHP